MIDIGSFAFSGCKLLCKINIPNSVKSICDNVFWNCVNLNEVVLQSNIAKISVSMFMGCDKLVKIIIPNDYIHSLNYSTNKLCIYNCEKQSI